MHVRSAREWERQDEWKAIDSIIVGLAAKKGELDVEIGHWLLAAREAGVHRHVGCASFAEYVVRRFGYDSKTAQEKLRVAEALETLPQLDALLRRGERSWSAVREITRVAKPETEAEWIEKTEGMTVRQIEALVARRKPGDRPSDLKDPVLATYRFVAELSPEDYADFLAAAEHVRKEIGAGATQRDVLRALIHKELGRRPETRPGYQTMVTVCIECERAWKHAGGRAIEVPGAVGDCARCDCTVVGATRIDEGITEEVTDASTETAHVGPDEVTAHVGPDETPHVGASDIERRLVDTLRGMVRKGGAPALIRVVSQILGGPYKSVTPALRSAVLARDGGRCVVPGCTHYLWIDLHHIKMRAEGGPNTLENIASICSHHHAQIHDGILSIEGAPSQGLVVRQASGPLYVVRATHPR